ncbi:MULTISPECIES: hypothetical protein [Rhizobium]|uniref:hypothetical protein n=1 Tax=Rhizobium TaxID=379 RepID=UPI00195A73A7|nr:MULTISPECIES: hypothetical protein [Rhizobium]MBM7048515.1 hypothetical protein [Rhizobium lusitanum]
MFSRGGFDAKTGRRRPPKIDAVFVALAQDNPDKMLVMAHIGQLVADGFAVWDMLDSGEIEVRFNSGEIFLLAETTILRLV